MVFFPARSDTRENLADIVGRHPTPSRHMIVCGSCSGRRLVGRAFDLDRPLYDAESSESRLGCSCGSI